MRVLGLRLRPPPQLRFDDLEELPAGTVEHLLGTLHRPLLHLRLRAFRPGTLLQPHFPVPGLQDLLPLRLPLEHLRAGGC